MLGKCPPTELPPPRPQGLITEQTWVTIIQLDRGEGGAKGEDDGEHADTILSASQRENSACSK